ncbi:transporter substrate-binding domain-containing protein [Zongyangia hominis]|uniref:Transporter substrate-binding domain-containing protein n=1 Tax=Zongyangia hominis TaxID=2763677 RepID=A0A926EC44_9FIRM|nr:transporter substrate-binding domain-containing protein [Zongyangia hominis]MBC8569231.1 transporter substrate-binding domain-containing protein [Zongyangia hominis]
MKQNKWISFFSLLLAMVMLASLCVTADAKQEKGRVVRVGYPIQWGLTEIDEDGNYRGYTYEYLQEIAQYTGWTYEFVQVPGDTDQSLGTLMDMLDKGEIDLMGGTLYSQALAETYNYSAFSYGTVDTVLQVLHDDPRDIVIDSQSNQKIRIAIIETSKMRRQELEEYCKLNLIEPEYILCKSGEEQLHALKSGRADALLNTSLNLFPGVRTIAKFSPKPFYFIMSKNNGQGLMQELNSAISSIEQADPYFFHHLV